MADEDSTSRILQWFSQLDAALSIQRKSLEQLRNSLQSISPMQMKILIKTDDDDDGNDEDCCISTEKSHDAEREDERIDFDEIDKILERAKSLRIVEEEAAEPHKSKSKQATEMRIPVSKIQAQREQRPVRLKADPAKTAAAIRCEGARKKTPVTSRPLQKSKAAVSIPKSSQGARKRAAASRTSVGAKSNISTAGVKPGSAAPRDDRHVVSAKKRGIIAVEEVTADAPKDKHVIEKDLREKVVVDKDIIDYCMEINNLKRKISNFMRSPAKDILNAKTEFLEAAESSFSDECYFSKAFDPGPDHIVSFRKAARRRLTEVSPILEAISSIKSQDAYVTSTEQLQKLFNMILKLQEMVTALEGKEILFQWSLKLLHSDKLTKSEKINTYRKMYGLLVNNGKSLPAMIEDSENFDHDEP